MLYYVYILYSAQLNEYYIASTQDVSQRLEKHLQNHKGFTGKAKDWELKYTETFNARDEALRRELQIKKWKSRKLIEKLINDRFK